LPSPANCSSASTQKHAMRVPNTPMQLDSPDSRSPGSHLSMRHSRSFASASLRERPPKAAYASPTRGEVKKSAADELPPIPIFKQPKTSRGANRARGLRQRCPRKQRAQGMPGAWCAAAACAVVESTRVSHHGHTGNARHSPRNGFNGFLRALPGDRAFLPPSPLRSLLLRNLMPASGHQDHTTSPSALAPLVLRRQSVHRIPHQRP
jgi:hypothetical protein